MLPRKSASRRARFAAPGHDETVLAELFELFGDDAHDGRRRGIQRRRVRGLLGEALLDALCALADRLADQESRDVGAHPRQIVVVELVAHEREPLRHASGVGDEDHQHPPAAELHELDVRDGRTRERRVLHDRDLAGQLRQRPHRAHEHVVEIGRSVEEGRDRRALRRRERPDLGEVIDEDPVALVGRHAARRRVRCRDQLLVLEERHVVADRRGRHAEGVPLDDRLAADGLTRVDVVLHDRPQNLQSAFGDHLASSPAPLALTSF